MKLRARTKTRTKARGVSSESVKFKVHDNPLESEWFLYESLVCSWYKLEPLGECVYQQKKVRSGIFHGITISRESVA